MPDAGFDNPRLVKLYDLAQADRGDLVHYERIVSELDADAVIDIGCGTGTLACRLALAGKSVVGVDPSPASLAIARAKPEANDVRWIDGDATSLGPLEADAALMTGNVAQVFLSDDAWSQTLDAVHAALRPGGHLVFETRDPTFRGWEEWTKDRSYSTIDVRDEGTVETWVDLVEVELPYVSFRWTYRFQRDSAVLHSRSTLRFRERDELEVSLRAAGYTVVDVRDAPDRPGKEFVFIAQRQL